MTDGPRFEQAVVLRTMTRAQDAESQGAHTVLLHERPLVMTQEWGSPAREVRWLDRSGNVVRTRESPDARDLIDAALHPSGDVTLLLVAHEGYSLRRLDAAGRTVAEFVIDDPDVRTDPPTLAAGAPSGPVERTTHDAARLAAIGEDVVVGARSERHSVVAYRVHYDGGAANEAPVRGSLSLAWRSLVVPAMSFMPVGLTGGSYDTFGQLEAQYAVHVAVDDTEHVYVAVNPPHLYALKFAAVHESVFGEKLEVDPDGLDFFVTRLSANGTRLGTSVVGTPEEDQLYGLHAEGSRAWAVGRKERWNAEGTGWDALVGRVDGETGGVEVQEFDVDESDIAFDVAAVPGNGIVVVGATGYRQNPHGASVSEECRPFARWLKDDGSTTDITMPSSPRHGEARSVRLVGTTGVAVSGMLDGPGTHSADADPSLLRAVGFLVDRPLR